MFNIFVGDSGIENTEKAEDAKSATMYAKIGGKWKVVPGTLESHMRFHPYDAIVEVAAVPGLDVENL